MSSFPPTNSPLGLMPQDQNVERLARASAARLGVPAAVHNEDMIMRFLLEHPGFKLKKGAVDYYFNDGAQSATQLARLLAYLNGPTPPGRLLEFACGYGCVTRHLAKSLPETELFCSDIHPQAMTFLRQELHVRNCHLSATNPEEFKCPGQFDAVFALSFFSHMPAKTWTRWLERLYSFLAEDGLLVFTAHGLHSRRFLGNPTIPAEGFWFAANSEQKDLSVADYGQTVVTLEFVHKAVRQSLNCSLALYREAYWWGHQDLYVVRRGKTSSGK
jgi:SAM-dependent methyltransferase